MEKAEFLSKANLSISPGSLRGKEWKRFLRGPDPALLEELYVPSLAEAVNYDRCCAYFSSSVLAAAARGFGKLIERLEVMGEKAPHPAVRLVVNEELSEDDVRALTETGDLSRLESLLGKRFKNPTELLEKKRLAMLGWLVKKGLFEIRVGVMRRGEGIVHAKFGIVTDEKGDAVIFSGSGNESAHGILCNYERLEVSSSWEDPERYKEYSQEFDTLWNDTHPDVHTLTLPEALRLRLVKFAPKEPPITEPSAAIARQKAAMIWQYIIESLYFKKGGSVCDSTAMVDLWPHQRRVIEETAEAWPEGRLLCDEVGMGKTIEAILVLRRLMAGRGVRRALILLPAGLLKQWQAELREKGGMIFPRLEGLTSLIWPDGSIKKIDGLPEALQQDVLLLSRETARTANNIPFMLDAEPWDLVILDESHHARRREQVEGEFNSGTLLLSLLRQLQLRRRAKGFLLMSATPMQTHPWEPWDLLSVIGEGGKWLSEFRGVRDYYEGLSGIHREVRCSQENALKIAAMVQGDDSFPALPGEIEPRMGFDDIVRKLRFMTSAKSEETLRWLRKGSPLMRRMHRNTRDTLRRYYEMGLLPSPPPLRKVTDEVFDFEDSGEREVYNSVSRYIEKRYRELESEKPGKGFVMTVYRRRASSSLFALERSLQRRREGLNRVIERKAYDIDLQLLDAPEAFLEDDVPDADIGVKISTAFPQDPQVARNELRELEAVFDEIMGLRGKDTKRDRFFDVLREVINDGRSVLVFTEYADTMEYLRDSLVSHFGTQLGCYSGVGGARWNRESWVSVTKDVITKNLMDGELRILLCTDAASEGLNLQAAGAIINYDLPWNPAKVEQRIGRIDRIGQKLSDVLVVNIFLKDSIDDKVYRALRMRCGLFEHFVGPMQPVLAKARRMLLGQEGFDMASIEMSAREVESDSIANEMYVENISSGEKSDIALLTRDDLVQSLSLLESELGTHVPVKLMPDKAIFAFSSRNKITMSSRVEVLEKNQNVLPLSPTTGPLRDLISLLHRGERLPLVVGSFQNGGFRASAAYWVKDGSYVSVDSLNELKNFVESWNGEHADPSFLVEVLKHAQEIAKKRVKSMETLAAKRQKKALEQQLSAARLRLQKELGRYLACLGFGTSDLNNVLYQQMTRDIATAQRLRKCIEKFGGKYPEWPQEFRNELD
ncbi:MAG: helicase-related protein, partial [Nanoarchaeota archaeon]